MYMQSETSAAPLNERPALRKFAVKGFSGKRLRMSFDSPNDVQDLEPLLTLSNCPADDGV
jgi:hypothetical protein